MQADRWNHVRAVFDRVYEAHPAERSALLDQLCEGDATLREEVETLLVGQSPQTLHTRGESPEADRDRDVPDLMIDRYKIMHKLGEGGFGAVYLAQQLSPIVRLVALKVLKLGMDSSEVLARFEVERQALALMDHPGIARVLDAGRTSQGRPYFVMELVRGVPITSYCEANRVSIETRLDLFQQVCEAVQHAHQKGIIHRDLKPSNVLVSHHDQRAVIKIIDFGIAKATSTFLSSAGLAVTQSTMFLGTPAYMSPEQASPGSLDVDTRSDIYSLGILLYELLTGTTPFDADELSKAGYEEIRRVLREVEPPKPSTRIASRAASVSANLGTHSRVATEAAVRGDLDWIVMRAIEKDRTRRYASAAELAADVGRHLAGQAVFAAPPGWWYRAGKFAGRHRVEVLAALLVFVSLVVAVGIAGTGMVQAERAREDERRARQASDRDRDAADIARESAARNEQLALQELSRSKATLAFLREVLESPQAERFGAEVRLIDVLRRSEGMIEGRFEGLPATELEVREMLGQLLLSLGAYEDAQPHVRRSLMLALRVGTQGGGGAPTEEDFRWATRYYQPVWRVALHTGRTDEAAATLAEALRTSDAESPRVRALKKFAESLQVSTAVFRRPVPESHLSASTSIPPADSAKTREANARSGDKARDEKVRRAREELENLLVSRGERDASTISARFELAERLAAIGDRDAASKEYEAATLADRGVRSERDVARVRQRLNHAEFVAKSLPPTQAVETLSEAIAEARSQLETPSLELIRTMRTLASYQASAGDATQALSRLQEAKQLAKSTFGDLHESTYLVRVDLVVALARAGAFDEAEREAREAVRCVEESGGSGGLQRGSAYGLLAVALRGTSRYEEAEQTFAKAIELNESAFPTMPTLTFDYRLQRAGCLKSLRRWSDAEAVLLWFTESDGRTFRKGVFTSMQKAVARQLLEVYTEMELGGLDSAPQKKRYWQQWLSDHASTTK